MKLDLGGVGHKDGWITVNIDASGYRAAPDIVADISNAAHELDAHFEKNSVDAIRCIHTLEHLDQWDIQPTLQYWRTFLKLGGEIYIVVPDMEGIIEDYSDGRIPMDVVAALTYVSGFRTKQGVKETHKWAWDYKSLANDLCKAGYYSPNRANDYPSTWLFDYPDMAYTACVGFYRVPNLIMRAWK